MGGNHFVPLVFDWSLMLWAPFDIENKSFLLGYGVKIDDAWNQGWRLGGALSSSLGGSAILPRHLLLPCPTLGLIRAAVALSFAEIKNSKWSLQVGEEEESPFLQEGALSEPSYFLSSVISFTPHHPFFSLVVDGRADRCIRDIRIQKWGGREGLGGKGHQERIIKCIVGGTSEDTVCFYFLFEKITVDIKEVELFFKTFTHQNQVIQCRPAEGRVAGVISHFTSVSLNISHRLKSAETTEGTDTDKVLTPVLEDIMK